MKLAFNYSIDCELPANTDYTGPERCSFFSGPPTWDFAEASVRGFLERMNALGVARGATLFVYPDVATHQRSLYRELADAGVEIALHLNGLRYSRLRGEEAKWLGQMNHDEQYNAISMGKYDLEDVIGKPCLGYRACYGSANADTFPICESLGFTWTSNSSNRYRPEFFSNWSGSSRFAHHTSLDNNLICGDMDLFEVPVTVGIHVYYDDSIRQPLDLRVETPPQVLGDTRTMIRQVIEENIIEMNRRGVPVPAIIGASHNTSLYADPGTHQSENLDWVVRHTQELADKYQYNFEPASFADMLSKAALVDSY
jgi:hypothetical protein